MNRKAGRLLAAELHDTLAPLTIGEDVPNTDRWRQALVSLEFWWPSVYGWELESLDGFDLLEARKTGGGRVELRGLALLITDQTWTPCAAELSVDAGGRSIQSYGLRLGQPGTGALGIDRTAKYGSVAARSLRAAVAKNPPVEGWVFEAVGPPAAPVRRRSGR